MEKEFIFTVATEVRNTFKKIRKIQLLDMVLLGYYVATFRMKKNRTDQGADKSVARPGRKQAGKHVRDARDFNNIET